MKSSKRESSSKKELFIMNGFCLTLRQIYLALQRKRNRLMGLVSVLLILLPTSFLLAQISDSALIISLISASKFSDAEDLIMKDLDTVREESGKVPDPHFEEAKLHYALTLCYYWDEEVKVIEHLQIIIDLLPSIEESNLLTELSRFMADFSMVYERTLNFARSRDYFGERVELYLEIYRKRVQIASILKDVRLADRLKRELILFQTNIIRDSFHDELDELHSSLDTILGRMERIRSVRD